MRLPGLPQRACLWVPTPPHPRLIAKVCGFSLNSHSCKDPIGIYKSTQERLGSLILPDIPVCQGMAHFVAGVHKVSPHEETKRWIDSSDFPSEAFGKLVAIGASLPPFHHGLNQYFCI